MSNKHGMKEKMARSMNNAMNSVMLSCKDAGELISDSIDGQLSFRQKMRLKAHLIFCRWCRLYKKQVEYISDLISAGTQTDKPPVQSSLSSDASQKIKKALEEKNPNK